VGELRDAVDTTLAALELADRDQAAAELARQLAEEIDRAGAAERWASRALIAYEEGDDGDMPELEEMIRALKAKVGHRDAIVRCGQRLEAVLVQLQATPAARAKESAGPKGFGGGPLALLRGGATG
jgi:hypothetical protein